MQPNIESLPIQALDAMREAMQRSPGNEEMGKKVRQLQSTAGGAAPAAKSKREKENQCGNEAAAKPAAISRSNSKETPAAMVIACCHFVTWRLRVHEASGSTLQT